MSIQDEINRINQNVANTYSALSDMGATLPETQNSDNIASTVRTIPQTGGGDASDNLIVTATANFANFTAEGIAANTFSQISDAYTQGKHIMLRMDIGQIAQGQTAIVNLSVFIPNSVAVFDTVVKMDDILYFIRGFIYANDTGSFSLDPVAKESDAVTEVFYVDGTFDMQTLTFSTDVTYADIAASAAMGKHVVARARTEASGLLVQMIFLPLSVLNIHSYIATFDGTMQVDGSSLGMASGRILLAVSVEMTGNGGSVKTKIRVVNATDVT